MDTPILLCVFNRPRQTQAAMDRLRAVRPSRLYIAADGPRPGHPTDGERCAEVRRIVSAVDWPCEARTLFREKNLGCKWSVGGGINWFFENEEEGLILEDDIVTEPTLFPYCAELLARYRDDERIGIVSGCNFTGGRAPSQESYIFVRNINLWGWATWRRVWKLVDLDMSDWNDHRSAAFLREYYDAPWAAQQAWERHFDNTVNRQVDTWDYQVAYAVWRHGLISIDPAVNLIDNDGMADPDATHPSAQKAQCLIDSPMRPLTFPLRHPTEVKRHPTADAIIDRDVYGITLPRSLHIMAKMRLRRVRDRLTGRYS